MIDEVVAFGCSFTQGEGVDHYRSYPYCLGYNLGVTTRNYGMGGASNKYAASEFFKNFQPEEYKNKLVVFGWTSHIRTAFWDEDANEWDHVLVQYFTKKERRKRDIEYYYSNIYTEFSAYFDTLVIKNVVKKFLDEYKIPYLFLNSLAEDPYWTLENSTLNKLKRALDTERYLDIDSSMQTWTQEDPAKYICYDQFHPSEEGHIMIAQKITDHIKKFNLLEIK